jgi:hypothetical protein
MITSLAGIPADYGVSLVEWPESKAANTAVEAEPNDTWQSANEIALGQTVWASADDKPFIVLLSQPEVKGRTPYGLSAEATTDRLPDGGID